MTYFDRDYLVGILIVACPVGAYVVGLFRGQRHPLKWRQFFAGMTDPLTRKGFAWVLGFPLGWILLYYAFLAHARLEVGRWPHPGEKFAGWALTAHSHAVELLLNAFIESLWVAAVLLVGCLFIPRWRYVSVYALCYGAGVGAVVCAWLVAPFLDWLFG